MSEPRHVGWPVDARTILDRAKRGLPVYWPTDPKKIQQDAYERFAEQRGANSQEWSA